LIGLVALLAFIAAALFDGLSVGRIAPAAHCDLTLKDGLRCRPVVSPAPGASR
jgi:hypothetical protein